MPAPHDINDALRLCAKYDIPLEDVLMMGINLSGVRYDKEDFARGRFTASPLGAGPFLLALTLNKESRFAHEGDRLTLADITIATASPVENDTCDDTYFRKNGRVITLNSNAKSQCIGCAFCGVYSLANDEKDLTSPARLHAKASELITESRSHDLSHIEGIGIVTGCFRSERAAADHIKMVRGVFIEHGLAGEVQYIGSQITTPSIIDELAADGRYAIYLTVECFDRRDKLMRADKANISLERGREALCYAKNAGLNTSMLYILGLDPLERIKEEMPKYKDALTRHPIVNLMQAYSAEQESLRHPEARDMDYYILGRKAIESVFLPTRMRPRSWENYRAPWSTAYGGERLDTII